ncbi:MAG: ABC transporter permease [Oscillospiraceae bacterium]|nr:ABC transporter permease [Oscillospiraceae bacterium]
MNFFKENIRIAVFSIQTNLMRSLLTMLGIIIGVSSVIAIITIGNGGRDFIVGLVRDMGQNMITISVNHNRVDASQMISRRDISSIRAMENVRHASPQMFSIGSFTSSQHEGMAVALAGNSDLQHVLGLQVQSGHFFTEAEYLSEMPVALIPTAGAMAFWGHTNVIGQRVQFTVGGQTETVRIIGIADFAIAAAGVGGFLDGGDDGGGPLDGLLGDIGGPLGGDAILVLYMPSSVIHRMTGGAGTYDNLSIIADDERNLDAVGSAAVNHLYITHGNAGSGAYTAVNMASYIDLLDSVINVFTLFIAGVSAISLVVGGIGVMNIMLVSVTERTREIGIRKALGAKTGTIMMQFLTESVILCLIGGTIGFIIGVAIAAFVAWFMGIPIAMAFTTVAIAVGFSSAIGIFFGIYPARRAAKMLPIEALRRE